MRITRLQIRDLRRHRELDLQLDPGLTIVRGPNESGKTTVQRALELALFRKVTATGADLESLRPWDGGEDSRPCVRVEFVQEDLDGSRSGTLETEFRGSRGQVRLDIDGQSITDPTRAAQVVADLTGIPSEAFFRSTASVRHHEMADLDRDEGALRDRLQASISGGDRGTSRARKRLESALHALTTRGERNPGRLKIAEEAVAQATAAVQSGEAQLAQLERDRDTLVRAREHRAQVDETLAERRSLLEKARQAERLTAEREAARQRFERYRTAVEVSGKIAELQASHPSAEALPVLRQIVTRLRTLEGQIRELTALLAGEVDVDYEVSMPLPTWRPTALFAIIASLAAVAVAALGLVTGDGLVQMGTAVVLGGLAIASGVISVRQHRVASDSRRHKQLREDQIARRLRGRSQLEQELREKQADFEAQLEALGMGDVAGVEQLLAAEEAHVQSIDRLTAQLEGLVGREPTETLPRQRDAAALDIEQKTGALEALGPIAHEPRARERLEVEVRDEEAALERARDDQAAAQARVEANSVDAEQVAGEAERLTGWQEQLAVLQRRVRIYETTLAEIDRAEQATMRRATRYLEKRMAADLGRLTGGRYRQARVDDRTLDIQLFSPEKGDWVSVGELSQGTRDLVYLAARIGLVRLVTQDRRPPLVFDDPFVTFDGERAARAITLLRELAADFQVLYLTTSERYDELANAVVVLPSATAVDDRSEAAGGSDGELAGSDGAPAARSTGSAGSAGGVGPGGAAGSAGASGSAGAAPGNA